MKHTEPDRYPPMLYTRLYQSMFLHLFPASRFEHFPPRYEGGLCEKISTCIQLNLLFLSWTKDPKTYMTVTKTN